MRRARATFHPCCEPARARVNPITLLKSYLRRTMDVSAWLRGEETSGASGPSLTLPYQQSAWVFSAVNKVAGPISSVELCWYLEDEEVEDPALESFWKAPALNADGSRMPMEDLLHAMASWLLLRGEAFLVMDSSWLLPFREVQKLGGLTPLVLARPERMRHLYSGGKITGWVWTDEGGAQVQLAVEQVCHVKLFNPYDAYRGLGPLEAAMIAAGADYASAAFAKNVAESNGDQGVYVIAKGGIPTDAQREQIVTQLRAKRARQQQGIFTPCFLSGDITIEDPQVRAMDAAFVAQRAENRKEIAAALGVPASFFDPVASYSIGSASDRFVLIEETCKPLGCKICAGLSAIAERMTGTPLRAKLDWDDHSTMQQVRRERLDGAAKLWAMGMPMAQVNDYLSLDLPEFPGWETGYLPFSVAPVAADPAETDPTTDPAYSEVPPTAANGEVPQDDPEEELKAAVRTYARAESKAALWKSHMTARRGTMKAFESKVTRALMEARRETLANIDAAKAIKRKSIAADFLFDLAKFTGELVASLRTVSANALQEAGQGLYKEIGRDDPFTMPSAEALRFLSLRNTAIAGAAQDMQEKVRASLQEGLTDGDTMDQLSRRVRTVFNGLSDYEAKRIALTETGAAYGKARHEAMTSAGVKYKAWISSHGPNVRPAHEAAEVRYGNDPIPVDEPFIVGGEALMFPGDPNGSAGNVINCQCVQIAVAVPGSE